MSGQHRPEAGALPDETRFSSRSIRSFVLRQGRMTEAQQRALDIQMPRIGVPYRNARLDLDELFGRRAPRVVEIGFGMGEATAEMAAAQPARDFLCIEVHGPGVGNLCKRVAEDDLHNVRIIQHDAVEVLEYMLGTDSVDGVHVYFPDPWHKKRYHKRRIIQPDFVARIARCLRAGGYLHCATDWQEYAEWMLEVLGNEASLVNTSAGGDYVPRPAWRPPTKFERRGERLGHGVWDLVFRRPAAAA